VVVLLHNLKNIFLVPDLRRKISIALGILCVYRLGAHIPVPGIDQTKLLQFMSEASKGILGYLNLISGGALTKFGIFALGITPYITASIMMQVLAMIVPYLEQLQKEGEYGRKVINQYTRYLTLVLSVTHGFWLVFYAESQGLVLNPGWAFRLTAILIF